MSGESHYVLPPFIKNHLHVESYAEIREIMESPDFLQGRSPERDLFFGGSLVMLDGDEHHERKRRFSALFTKNAIIHYETQLMEPVIRQALSELGVAGKDAGLVRADLVPLVRIMLHRISATVTGIDGVETPEETERFRLLIEKLAEAAAGQWTLKDRDALMKEGLEARHELIERFLRSSLVRRRELVRRFRTGEIRESDLPMDILTLICLHGDSGSVDPDEDAYVWRECTLFMTAATQTTSHQLPHVVQHISDWIAAHPEDAHKVTDPAFLRLAVNESLRLHQTAPVKTRIAARTVTLKSGRVIPEGEMVALFAPNANLEPEIYGPDAARFNPYREVPKGAQPWGLTFGAGAHSCLGKNLVTGLFNRADTKTGAEGTMVKILTILYTNGLRLDPQDPPQRVTSSFHDAFARMPILLGAS